MDFASYGLSWELVSYMRLRSALYVGPCLPIAQCPLSKALHDANDALLGTSLASLNPIFTAFLTLALEHSPLTSFAVKAQA